MGNMIIPGIHAGTAITNCSIVYSWTNPLELHCPTLSTKESSPTKPTPFVTALLLTYRGHRHTHTTHGQTQWDALIHNSWPLAPSAHLFIQSPVVPSLSHCTAAEHQLRKQKCTVTCLPTHGLTGTGHWASVAKQTLDHW